MLTAEPVELAPVIEIAGRSGRGFHGERSSPRGVIAGHTRPRSQEADEAWSGMIVEIAIMTIREALDGYDDGRQTIGQLVRTLAIASNRAQLQLRTDGE